MANAGPSTSVDMYATLLLGVYGTGHFPTTLVLCKIPRSTSSLRISSSTVTVMVMITAFSFFFSFPTLVLHCWRAQRGRGHFISCWQSYLARCYATGMALHNHGGMETKRKLALSTLNSITVERVPGSVIIRNSKLRFPAPNIMA